MSVVRPETYKRVRVRRVHGGRVERLKPGLRHAFSVSTGVQRSFHEQNGMLFKRDLGMIPT